LISEIYPHALDCGLAPADFWELSLAEITDLMESYERRQKAEYKRDLTLKHFLAKDIGQYVSLVLGGSKVKILELWDYFPELFENERESIEENQKHRQMEVYKAQMIDFASRHNNRNGGGK